MYVEDIEAITFESLHGDMAEEAGVAVKMPCGSAEATTEEGWKEAVELLQSIRPEWI